MVFWKNPNVSSDIFRSQRFDKIFYSFQYYKQVGVKDRDNSYDVAFVTGAKKITLFFWSI